MENCCRFVFDKNTDSFFMSISIEVSSQKVTRANWNKNDDEEVYRFITKYCMEHALSVSVVSGKVHAMYSVPYMCIHLQCM